MGQAQLGGMGSLPGYGGSSFGGANGTQAGLTGAVKGATGALTEYNPQTMSETTKAAPPSTAPEFTAAGMDSTSGMPSYVTNWLQSGGTGTMPTSTGIMPASPVAQSTAGDLFKPTTGAKIKSKEPAAWVSPPAPKTVTKTPAAAGAGAATGIQAVNMPQFTQQGPLVVNDQWGGGPGQSSGTSQQVATPALGSPVNPFASLIQPNGVMPQFFSDGKGNFFSDAQGKVPVPANVATILQRGGLK